MLSQVYKSKIKLIPSVEEVISSLCSFEIDFVLVGSEVGKIYNLCEYTKDIDLKINLSKKNFKKLHKYLKQYFNIDFKSLYSLNRIVLLAKEKKIEIFIREETGDLSYPFTTYNFNKKNRIKKNIFNNLITILSEEEYISCVKKYITYHTLRGDVYSISKYTKILDKYNKKYSI